MGGSGGGAGRDGACHPVPCSATALLPDLCTHPATPLCPAPWGPPSATPSVALCTSHPLLQKSSRTASRSPAAFAGNPIPQPALARRGVLVLPPAHRQHRERGLTGSAPVHPLRIVTGHHKLPLPLPFSPLPSHLPLPAGCCWGCSSSLTPSVRNAPGPRSQSVCTLLAAHVQLAQSTMDRQRLRLLLY